MIKCKVCGTHSSLKQLLIKFGGLLCPECNIILFEYGSDEYKKKLAIIKKMWENKEKGKK